MIGYIALCKKQGIVNRVIRSNPLGIINEGRDIRLLFEDCEQLGKLIRQPTGQGATLRLRMKTEGNPEVYVTVRALEELRLVLVYDAGDPSRTPQLVETVLSVMDIPEVLGQEPYGAGYYEIQRLNSQLINYQRTLAKTNVRLKALLEETREAKSTIEVLERDSVTGLYLEKVFYDRVLDVMLRNPEREFDMVAVDIEQFKIVNDAYGTETGDRLLMDLAGCLTGLSIGGEMLLTRARADTFFALVERKTADYPVVAMQVGAFLEGYPLPMRLQARIGVYQIDSRELAVARMCDRALLAANSIKGNYSERFARYSHVMHDKMILEQKIVNTMVESIERGDFQVYLQPKVEIDTGAVMGAEALVRWNHPEFGMISPGDFIPVFERNGFIYTLDLYVWRKACAMLRDWNNTGKGSIHISVNVSRTDLYHENLPEILSGMVREYGLNPEELHLEITESAYVKDSAQLLFVIQKLKQAGFIIEMDDFGSGYSSLNTLADLPIDVMKLDMKFLSQTENRERRHKVMQLVIDLAYNLRLQVIAEGVETEEQAVLLKEMGCHHAQGYYYGRPMPEQDFLSCI